MVVGVRRCPRNFYMGVNGKTWYEESLLAFEKALRWSARHQKEERTYSKEKIPSECFKQNPTEEEAKDTRGIGWGAKSLRTTCGI